MSLLSFSYLFCILLTFRTCIGQSDIFSHCTELGRCYQECNFDSNCDELPKLPSLNGKILYYTTSQNGEKFSEHFTEWGVSNESIPINLEIDTTKTYQKIIGFGGAFTDATSINLQSLPSANLMNDILTSYFSSDIGSGYTLGRVPIASCDFSMESYTYSPIPNDFELKYFNLTAQDYGNETVLGRFEVINQAKLLSLDTLRLFATPWTAPPWFKTNNNYIGGHLNNNRTYWDVYSNYFVKYLKYYEEYGNITFYGITPQNEPHSPSPWESMTWSTLELAEFISDFLGPKIKTYNSDIKIFAYDGQKGFLPEEGIEYFNNNNKYNASLYIDAIAVHWYVVPPPTEGCITCNGAFNEINLMYNYIQNNMNSNSDVFIINTEACSGFSDIESPPNRGVSLGNINRAQQYIEDIIGDLNNNVSAWCDWNMILNINGGPNHVGNICDAPIIIDINNKLYYKQPMYYYLAHISKFIRPNSVRIGINTITGKQEYLWYTAVIDNNELHKTIIILLNTNKQNSIQVQLYDKRYGYSTILLPPKSVQTVLYDN